MPIGVRRGLRRAARPFAALLLAWTVTNPARAEITAAVEGEEIRAGQSFVLSFQSDTGGGRPDLSPLQRDFEVLGTARRTNISIENGRAMRTTLWQVKLIPRHAGSVTIPSIEFGAERSQPLTIAIAPATGGPDDAGNRLRLEVTATPQAPYVQQQVLLTVRLFVPQEVDLVESSFGDPRVDGGDALITAAGKVRERQRTERGVRERMIERTYAIFPQTHGELVIEPLTFEGQVFESQATFDNPFGQSIRTRRLQSEPIPLRVRPVPREFKGRHWLPAQSLTLVENWSEENATLKAGEPIARSLTLLAKGLTAGQLPEIAVAMPEVVKSYPEAPVLDDHGRSEGITGLRMEKQTLIINANGAVTLPEIRIPWWNTGTDRPEVAVIAAQTLQVVGGIPAPRETPPTPAAAPAPAPAATTPGPRTPPAPPFWRHLAILLASGWALTSLAWWRSRAHAARHAGGPSDSVPPGSEAARIADQVLAYARNDDAVRTRQALQRWASARTINPATLDGIARRHPDLAPALQELDRCLYAGGPAGWSGAELATAFAISHRSPGVARDRPTTQPTALAPLYLSSETDPR
ncbi:MAG: hypothetical protein NFCOHLIN_02385 [Gammaproteobacteria bacterium]|nr:hypothetical protein [Gammaproteobacteria bacterium]